MGQGDPSLRLKNGYAQDDPLRKVESVARKNPLAGRRVGVKSRKQRTYGSVSPPTSSWDTLVRVSIHEARSDFPFHALPV